jgi:hypothetical protein
MKRLLLLLTLCSLSLVAAAQSVAKPQSIIFETDMGNDIDDAMALDLLFKNMDQGNINLLGVSVHKNNPHSAEYIDIMRHWYGYKKLPSVSIPPALRIWIASITAPLSAN